MDPVSTLIVTALSSGAAALLKTGLRKAAESMGEGASDALGPMAKQAIEDAYAGLKGVLKQKFADVGNIVPAVDAVEREPESKDWQHMLEAELEKYEADQDEDVLVKTQELLRAVKALSPEVAETVGVKLEDVEAAAVRVQAVRVRGVGGATVGVDLKRVKTAGDISLGRIEVDSGPETENP